MSRPLAAALPQMTGALGRRAVGARLLVPLLGLVFHVGIGVQPADAVTCDSSTPSPWTSDPGTTILADNFESGAFGHWSSVVMGGDGAAYVSTSHRVDGWCAGKLHVTTAWNSRAYLRKYVGWYAGDLWASGWFFVDNQGVSGNDVPFFRFWKDSLRVADIYRHNIDGGFWLRSANGSGGWKFVNLNRWISMDAWHLVKLHVKPAWSSSAVEVWLDGSMVYSNWAYYLPAGSLNSVMLGSEHTRQAMDLYFDDVVLKAS